MQLQVIQKRIHEITGQKVMLDFDLAELYEVEARILNQSVKRNIKRFPIDFMFRISEKEWDFIQTQTSTSSKRAKNSSQIVMSSIKHRGSKYLPYAFTEQGVDMLSAALRSVKPLT